MIALIAPFCFAGTIAAGAVIEDAATLDITPEGFDAVELLIPALLPSSIPVDDVDGGLYYITGLVALWKCRLYLSRND